MEENRTDCLSLKRAKRNRASEGFAHSLIENGDFYVGFYNEEVGKHVRSGGCLCHGLRSKGKISGVLPSTVSVPQGVSKEEMRRLGEVTCKGHGSYKLVLVLQLGIRYFVLKSMDWPKRELSTLDFRSTACTRIRFPRDISTHSPHEFKCKDYCPAVFRHLQELDNIDAVDYMLSVCGYETLRQLTSPGKSGCLFYSSRDDRFVVKTMRKSETKVLLKMLPNYYRHVQKYGNTLLTRFYGFHVVTPVGGHKVHFVVMGNVFSSELQIHRRFDLKGSSQGRCVSKEGADQSTTFKDLDLNLAFYLDPSMRNQLLMQIKHDSDFLEAEGVMDYSLLLGLRLCSTSRGSFAKGSSDGRIMTSVPCNSFQSCMEQVPTHPDEDPPLSCTRGSDHKLGVKMPARAIRVNKIGTLVVASNQRIPAKEDYNVVLYVGIIDILQGYNVVKRIEHIYKSLQFDSQSISAVNPKAYSSRFLDFLCNVFPPHDFDA